MVFFRSGTTHRLVVALLMVATLVPFGAPATAKDESGPEVPQGDSRDGWILVPTHPLARSFSAGSFVGITHDIITVRHHVPFELRWFNGAGLGSCIGPNCVESGDFDIVFLAEQEDGRTELLERHSTVGPESGRVPHGASLAVIHLTTPSLSPGIRGHHYLYTEGNPNAEKVVEADDT